MLVPLPQRGSNSPGNGSERLGQDTQWCGPAPVWEAIRLTPSGPGSQLGTSEMHKIMNDEKVIDFSLILLGKASKAP